MIGQLLNVAKNAAAFLQTGKCPPNTPYEHQRELGKKNHLSSKKFFLASSGFIILGLFYVSSVALLFLMQEHEAMTNAYTIIFSKTIEVFATVMAVYLGGQSLVDLKYNSSSSVNSDTKVVIKPDNKKEDDYTLEVK